VRLPALGESASADLSVNQERRIGDTILREGRRDPAFLDDPILLDYVQQLYEPLLRAARQRGDIEPDIDRAFAWEIFLINDRSVNAFALPGGYVGVHLGLIALTTTPDALASVLAHELTHVTQRHIARSIAPQQQASLLAVAGLLLGVLAASRASGGTAVDGANAAIMGGQAAAIQTQLNFTRAMEREADRVGFGLLADAGYNTNGMAQMFEKLAFANRINDTNNFPYLRTHPLTTDRITEARTRVLAQPMPPAEPTLLHALMQSRSRVLMDSGAQALARLSGESSSPSEIDRIAAQLAGALAASQLKEHGRAERLLTEARAAAAALPSRDARAERALLLMHAELRQAAGDARGALALLDALPPLPADAARSMARAPMLLRAQLLLDLRRTQPAAAEPAALRASTEALQTWLAEHPQDAAAWERLAGTADAMGQRLRSLRAAAEARATLGDLAGAIDRFRVAQQAARGASGQQDFIEASVIDARLRQLLAQRREMQLEAGRGGGPR
jgi:predicted Zn-dependent protease